MRKHYIDNLRWFCILLLFPYHAAMVFNSWGENFYIFSQPVKPISAFIIATYPWFMPLLFVLAGISSFYALQKCSNWQYIRERIFKLLIPLVFGILFLVPVQTYFAERFHNQYSGSYFAQYILFFTKPTDLSGYTGGFTPGQLWFLLYLFIISLLALPLMRLYLRSAKKLDGKKWTPLKLLPLFLVPLVLSPVLDISGKSVGRFFALFMLGFLVLSNEEVLESLEKSRWPLTAAASLLTVTKLITYFQFNFVSGIPAGIFDTLVMWVCILALLGLGKRYFNQDTPLTAYLSRASFPVYVLHQSCLVAVAYYVVTSIHSIALQYILITLLSAALTFTLYEVVKRIPLIRSGLGIRA